MRQWVRRARSAVVMGLVWAAVWAPAAVLASLVLDPDGSMDEPWLLVGAFPGFLGGVVFALVLGVVARRRRLEELSLPRTAGWGALAGLIVGVLPFLLGSPGPGLPAWFAPAVIGTIALLASLSAAGSLALARRGARRERAVAADGR